MKENIRLGIIVLVATTVGGMLAPVGAGAAGELFTIVDANSDDKAQVDNGRLRVGDGAGRLSVDGVVSTRDRSGWDQHVVNLSGTAPDEEPTVSTEEYTVPAGKRFVITTVTASWDIWSASGQISLLSLVTSEGNFWLPARNYTQFTSMRRYWIFEQVDLTVPAGGTIRMEGTRTQHSDGTTAVVARIVGYLVPA